jgi:hypothetical protein
MADQKISELTALTGANVADTDLLPIVDTSATETKKITFGEFKTALDTATGFVRITGDTMTGNLSFGDNNKAIFGAGSDLQIYHDGSGNHLLMKLEMADYTLELLMVFLCQTPATLCTCLHMTLVMWLYITTALPNSPPPPRALM